MRRFEIGTVTAALAALALLAPASSQAAVSVGATLMHSADDFSGFTTLSGNDNVVNVTLPFTFVVEGTPYTTIALSTNGWIEFGGNTAPDSDPTSSS